MTLQELQLLVETKEDDTIRKVLVILLECLNKGESLDMAVEKVKALLIR